MTWTYGGNPQESVLDAVRLMIGDTDSNQPLLQDEEIEYNLELSNNNPTKAAIKCCSNIIAQLSRLVDYKIGPEQVSLSQKVTNFTTLRNELKEALANQNIGAPSFKPSPPHFDLGMHDNRGS